MSLFALEGAMHLFGWLLRCHSSPKAIHRVFWRITATKEAEELVCSVAQHKEEEEKEDEEEATSKAMMEGEAADEAADEVIPRAYRVVSMVTEKD